MNNVYVPSVTVKLKPVVCASCATHFAIDESLYDKCYNEGKTFYCPNGHSLSWSETESDRLKRENEALARKARSAEFSLIWEKNQHRATKGQFTKYRNRIANGVCPCCHRTFKQLAQHMHSKHPALVGGPKDPTAYLKPPKPEASRQQSEFCPHCGPGSGKPIHHRSRHLNRRAA